jgi:hypothetical protein
MRRSKQPVRATSSRCSSTPTGSSGPGASRELRRASATATPNSRLVALADRMLGRDGRMVAAIDAIGRGEIAYEADPFRLELE